MASTTTCPACGLASSASDVRCPRCNALKLTACTGTCTTCKSGCDTPVPAGASQKKGRAHRECA